MKKASIKEADAFVDGYKVGMIDGAFNAHKHTLENFKYYENLGWNEAIEAAKKIANSHKCGWGMDCTDEDCDGNMVGTGECGKVITEEIEKLKKEN